MMSIAFPGKGRAHWAEQGATTEAVYRCLIAFKRDSGGDSPTARELATILDIPSTSTVAYHLRKLEKAGRIIRPAGIHARRIVVPGYEWRPVNGA
jgi:DNA-binding MarR family transcriptional regulator